jgi:anaerobic magnesium-protoporphyrin IX monomethyl ester cyclase
MKILLVNPPYYINLDSRAEVKRNTVESAWPPLWAAYLAGAVRDAGHDVQILDLNLYLDNPIAALINSLKTFLPRVVGFTVNTPLVNTVEELTRQVKFFHPSIFTIWGGHHVSALPDKDLCNTLVDVYIKGESEIELVRLLSDLKPGIIHAVKIEDLDGLPLPAHDLIRYQDYPYAKAVIVRKPPVGFVQTIRGCRGKCSFCSRVISGANIRLKSVDRIFQEIDLLLAQGVREIHFQDDNLVESRERMVEFCQRYHEGDYTFPWVPSNAVRVDSVDQPLLKMMKEAGCYRVPFGVESGSQRVLDGVDKGIRKKDVDKAMKWAKQAGLITTGVFMMGLPGETRQDLKRTIIWALRLNPDYFNVSACTPYPGTRLYQQIKREGRLLCQDWSQYHYTNTQQGKIYRHDTLDWSVIDKYIRRFYRKFYFRPTKIWGIMREAVSQGRFWDYTRVLIGTKWT